MELFKHPSFLAAAAAALAALAFFRFRAEQWRRAAARAVLGPEADRLESAPGAQRRNTRDLLFLAALALAGAAAAGPQWGVELAPLTDLRGNLVVAVDASLSMGAKDLKPSRLENARLLLGSLTEKFADYRLGLVAFAGSAYVQCPLTTDQEAIMYFASSLAPGMLPSQGTDLADAILTSLNMLSRHGGQKVLVIITDGEDHSKNLDEALAAAAEQNLKVFTVGLGSAEGELIPVSDGYGNVMEYKKDSSGKTVVSRLGESTLIKIAEATGAAYIRYTGPESAAEDILKAISGMELEKTRGKGRSNYKNRFQWPLSLALLLLLIEFLLMDKGFSFRLPEKARFWKRMFPGAGAAALLLLFCAGPARAAEAVSLAKKGNSAYAKEDWPKAFEYYSRAAAAAPADKRMEYNLGASIYKMEDWPKAIETFEQAAKDPKIAARAGYSRANALLKSGDTAGAVSGYRAVLKLEPNDENAKFNLQKALEQQKKNQCQQQQDKDKKDNKDKDKKDKGGEDKKDKKDGENGDKDKQKQQNEQQKEQERKKAEARERSRQVLEMMKEKEKEAARENKAALQPLQKGKPEKRNEEDW